MGVSGSGVPYFALAPGVRYTSIPFTTNGLAIAGEVNIFSGAGFGFIILASDDGPHTTVVKVNVLGQGKMGNDVLYVTPNVWYHGPFSGIKAIPNELLSSNQTDLGNWICNIAVKEDAEVFPSSSPLNSTNFPAASGGSPVVTEASFTVPQAAASPAGAGAGQAIGAIAQVESIFQVLIIAPDAETFTGGGIDLWFYAHSNWFIVAQNLPVIVGFDHVGFAMDQFGPRSAGNRWAISSSSVNPVTTSGAGTTFTAFLRIQ